MTTSLALVVEWDNMKSILVGISLMLENDFLQAALPLFSDGEIAILEWSFDTTINTTKTPDWLPELLNEYGNNNRLLGHGVYYSLFDARWTERQNNWLNHLKKETQKHNYTHISEHFGFMSSDNYHKSVPLPISLHSKTLQIGIDRLKRLQNAVELPVGIENLALAFSLNDVREQGIFIDKMLDDIGGFLILDLHNIYCQAHNFDIDIFEIIDSYPLERVKEIHISGGSWQESIYQKNSTIRRDTHDDDVPEIIFQILPKVISQCPNLECIILERLGNTFYNNENVLKYQTDFRRIKAIAEKQLSKSNFSWGKTFTLNEIPLTDSLLAQEQRILAQLLLEEKEIQSIKNYNFNYWDTQNWNLEMINTAKEISLKWDRM